jgi:tagatose-1,6-bisphosphate aldolase
VGTEEVHGGLVDLENYTRFLHLLKEEFSYRNQEGAWPAFVVDQVGTNLHTTSFDPAMAQRLYQITVPWILLSASVDFETYVRQAEIAAKAVASGVAVGRAVWKEAVKLSGQERCAFLNGEALTRMKQISDIVDDLATPWSSF